MKPKHSLALGFGLGLLAFFLMAQTRPPVPATPLRYTITQTGYGLVVMDTSTGVVKLVKGDPRSSGAPNATMEYGQPFGP